MKRLLYTLSVTVFFALASCSSSPINSKFSKIEKLGDELYKLEKERQDVKREIKDKEYEMTKILVTIDRDRLSDKEEKRLEKILYD